MITIYPIAPPTPKKTPIKKKPAKKNNLSPNVKQEDDDVSRVNNTIDHIGFILVTYFNQMQKDDDHAEDQIGFGETFEDYCPKKCKLLRHTINFS